MRTSLARKKSEEARRQRLLDRQDYRVALLNRREEVDKKIAAVEDQIKELRR